MDYSKQLRKARRRERIGTVGCWVCRTWSCGRAGRDRGVKHYSGRARRQVDRLECRRPE